MAAGGSASSGSASSDSTSSDSTSSGSTSRDFVQRLASGVVVCDGAMGTMLHTAGISFDRALSQLNLTRPELVSEIHRSYLSAGAAVIETNTFDANRYRLARHGLAEHAAAFNRTGAELAVRSRDQQRSDALVAGSIGPLLAPNAREAEVDGDVGDAIAEQVEALVAGGVELLMFETFGNLEHLVAALRVAAEASRVPIVAQMTFLEDGRTIGGDRPEAVAHALEEVGVAALGVNCTLGPQGVGQVLDELVASTDVPLSALPNAGIPARVGDQFHYPANEAYFARAARGFVERGATIVGGCCGTTPAHIASLVDALRPPVTRVRAARARPPTVVGERPGDEPGNFAARLASGTFTVGCELPPTPGADGQAAIRAATHLVEVGAHALVIPPPRSSRPQIGPVPLGVLLRSRLDVETILTATTWDKSLLGLQADLLGAHAFDLHAVICRTGGPIPQGDYPSGAGLWDVDSVGLIELLRSLNESDRSPGGGASSGSASGGGSSGAGGAAPLQFHIGATVNPNAADLATEVRHARRKIDAGAHFLVTHPVFATTGLRRLQAELERPGVPILLGVMPLRDFEHAEYLHQEVPDTDIPETVLERMRKAGPDGVRAGRDLATELVAEATCLVQGVVISPATSGLPETGETLRAILEAAGR